MFNNIGKKVKIMAQVICFIGIVAWIIVGISYCLHWRAFFTGILVAILGSFLSWLSSLALYAIGHIAENTEAILRKLNNKSTFRTEVSETLTADIPKATQYKKADAEKTQSVGSWWCTCGAINKDSASSCSVCCKQRPQK